MPDFASTDEEQEFAQFVDALEDEGEQVMAEADRVDQQAAKQAQAKKAEHDEVVTKAEYMTDKFLASASEDEKKLFSIYSHGADSPEKIRSAIELARTNAAEAAKAIGAEVEEKAEEKATKLAADQYGVGPIANGTPSPPVDDWEAGRARVRQGDMHTAFQMFNSLPSTGGVTKEE